MIAAALDNPALHAVFEEPKRKRARSRAQGALSAGSGRSAWHACTGPRYRLIALSTAGAAPDTGGAQHASPSAPGLRSPSAAEARTPTTAHERRLLSESRLAPTYEPPAEEPNQSTNNSDHSHRDACYGPHAEIGATITGSTTLHEVAEDGATIARWSRAVQAALDAPDTPAVCLAGRACAAGEECPAARGTDPLHRATSGTERGRRLTEWHSTVWRWQWGQKALEAATDRRVGAVSGCA